MLNERSNERISNAQNFPKKYSTGSGPSSRRGSLFDDSRRPSLIINDEVSICLYDDGG
jgi:hypothetical protein